MLGVYQLYLNDILIYNDTLADQLEYVVKLLERVKIHELKWHLKICHFISLRVEHLGHAFTFSEVTRK